MSEAITEAIKRIEGMGRLYNANATPAIDNILDILKEESEKETLCENCKRLEDEIDDIENTIEDGRPSPKNNIS
ncbi:MAG: hypothetical protein IIC69_03365 [Nanoarchaeota archaeon]|nr:hypothetical protein [Nanoarchaeota archaeon]